MTNKVKCAVTTALPSDTVTFVGLKNKLEAYYLAGVLNSDIVGNAVNSYSSAGRGFGSTHILRNIKIKKF